MSEISSLRDSSSSSYMCTCKPGAGRRAGLGARCGPQSLAAPHRRPCARACDLAPPCRSPACRTPPAWRPGACALDGSASVSLCRFWRPADSPSRSAAPAAPRPHAGLRAGGQAVETPPAPTQLLKCGTTPTSRLFQQRVRHPGPSAGTAAPTAASCSLMCARSPAQGRTPPNSGGHDLGAQEGKGSLADLHLSRHWLPRMLCARGGAPGSCPAAPDRRESSGPLSGSCHPSLRRAYTWLQLSPESGPEGNHARQCCSCDPRPAGGPMSAHEYSRALAKVVVAQIAELQGAEACQESAVDILADLLVRLLQQLCNGAHDYAETAGRTEFNIADVLLSLEDLGFTPEELRQYVELQVRAGVEPAWGSMLAHGGATTCQQPSSAPCPPLQGEGVPFAHTVPQYPVHTQPLGAPTFLDKAESAPAHIPPFLPAFPDPHTYQQTPSLPVHEADPTKQRQVRAARGACLKTGRTGPWQHGLHHEHAPPPARPPARTQRAPSTASALHPGPAGPAGGAAAEAEGGGGARAPAPAAGQSGGGQPLHAASRGAAADGSRQRRRRVRLGSARRRAGIRRVVRPRGSAASLPDGAACQGEGSAGGPAGFVGAAAGAGGRHSPAC